MKIKTYLPVFPGFYGTIFEPSEDSEIEYVNDERKKKGLPKVDFDDMRFNYDEYRNDVAKKACNFLERELSDYVKSIKFDELRSPRFYNYSNDSINCIIEPKIKPIRKYLSDNSEAFDQYLKDQYTSYDGFISSYDNNRGDFMEGQPFAHRHKLGSILEFICQNEGINQESLYYGCDDCYLSVTNFEELTTVNPE